MKYDYNYELGAFEREDKIGKKIWATMDEAQRIITLKELGYTRGEIQSKMNFKSKKATGYTVYTILDKYENGDLKIDMNAPVTPDDFKDFSIDDRVSKLEERMNEFEKNNSESEKTGWINKIKSWFDI